MRLIITGATDGAAWGEPEVISLSTVDDLAAQVGTKIFDLLAHQIGEYEPGKVTDECVSEIMPNAVYDEGKAWVHRSEADHGSVEYWIMVAIIGGN
jgi:hypothetical protein